MAVAILILFGLFKFCSATCRTAKQQITYFLFYFIEVLLVHPRKPKCFCQKQNIFSPKYRSGAAKKDPLEQFVCLQSLNIRIDMTQCVTFARARWHLSLVFMIITKCRRENQLLQPKKNKASRNCFQIKRFFHDSSEV